MQGCSPSPTSFGGSLPGYRLPGHPVQEAILESVGCFTGLERRQIAIGLDGCGVPCFGISIYRMALAFARLLAPGDEIPGAFRGRPQGFVTRSDDCSTRTSWRAGSGSTPT